MLHMPTMKPEEVLDLVRNGEDSTVESGSAARVAKRALKSWNGCCRPRADCGTASSRCQETRC